MARAALHVSYPARVKLITAKNPCRCGSLGDASHVCSRAPESAVDYQARLWGRLLDRVNLHVEVPAVSAADLALPPPTESSADVAARVAAARAIQTARYAGHVERPNAKADGKLLEAAATLRQRGAQIAFPGRQIAVNVGARLYPGAARRAHARRSRRRQNYCPNSRGRGV